MILMFTYTICINKAVYLCVSVFTHVCLCLPMCVCVYLCVSVFTHVILLLMMTARHLDLEVTYNVTLSGVFLVKHIYVLEFCKVHSLHMMMIVIGYENEDLRLQISNTFKSLHKASTVLSLNRYTALVSALIVLLPFFVLVVHLHIFLHKLFLHILSLSDTFQDQTKKIRHTPKELL